MHITSNSNRVVELIRLLANQVLPFRHIAYASIRIEPNVVSDVRTWQLVFHWRAPGESRPWFQMEHCLV